MNIREMIDHLHRVADDLPDGLDARVWLHVCNGHDEPAIRTGHVEVVPEREYDETMTEVHSAHALVIAHPHRDETKALFQPVTMDVDDELARLVDAHESTDKVSFETEPGATSVTVDMGNGVAYTIPLDDDGLPMMPGSPEAVEAGCVCDPERNDHGRGVRQANGNLRFIFDHRCTAHPRSS